MRIHFSTRKPYWKLYFIINIDFKVYLFGFNKLIQYYEIVRNSIFVCYLVKCIIL